MNDAAVAWFVGILLTAIAAVYTAALVAFGVWFVREWIRESRRRRDWRMRLDRARSSSGASGFTSVDGSGNVRVIGGEPRG